MASQGPRLKIVRPMDSPLPYAQRFLAEHPKLGHQLEMRMPPGAEGEAPWEHFTQELACLSILDHPSFPPVLDRGTVQSRPFLALPRREGVPVTQLVQDDDWTEPMRVRAVETLAGALGEAHRKGVVLGGIHPLLVHWNGRRNHAELPFPLGMRSSRALAGLPVPPASFGFEAWDPRSQDVYFWGAVAYWLLARTAQAYGPDGEVVPIAEHRVGIRPEVAYVVETCLGPRSDERPGDGVELHAVLARLRRSFVAEFSAGDPSATQETMLTTLAEVRLERKETGAPTLAFARIHQMQDLLAPLVEETRERFSSLSEGQRRLAGAVAALALALVVAWPWVEPYTRWGTLGGSVVEGGLFSEEHRREELSQDPYVRGLLAVGKITPANFQPAWARLRNLSLQGRLPDGVVDRQGVTKLAQRFRKDPEGACDAFDGLLVKLEDALGG